jgi:hypothetical protein
MATAAISSWYGGRRRFTRDPRDHAASLRFYVGAAVFWHSGAPAQERRSTDFIVPLGYCQLTSVAFFEF